MNRPFIPDGDPAVDDVRRARHELSALFDHDPARLLAHLRSRQNLRPEGLISYEKQPADPTEGDVAPIVDPVREARRERTIPEPQETKS